MIFNSALSFLLYSNLTSKRQMPESPPESQQDVAGIGIGKGVGITRNR